MNIDYPNRNQLPALQGLWKQAFGDTESFLQDFFSTGFSPGRCRCLTRNGQLIAALYWFDCAANGQKLAYLYAIATDKDHQSQGFCRRLMDDTHRLLADSGYAAAILVPGNQDLFSFYGKIGYRPFGGIRRFSVNAGATCAEVKKLSAQEYANLRKAYLPQGGVCQEGETLAFLATQNDFYAGADFLITVAKENASLFISELLGNASAAPQIVRTFGAATGDFRAPGAEPFALYLPLSSDLQIPAYFGLALD